MSYSNLISVKFTDATNYASFDNTDILGCPIEHSWGPIDKLMVLDKRTFLETFPESMPIGVKDQDISYLYAWAQLKKAFDSGMSKVETIRVKGGYKYNQFNLNHTTTVTDPEEDETESTTVTTTTFTSELSDNQFDSDSDISISFKYPGLPPKSQYPYESIKVSVSCNETGGDPIVIKVIGIDSASKETLIEELRGGFIPGQLVDGSNFHISTVAEEKSKLISVQVNNAITASITDKTATNQTYAQPTKTDADEFKKYLTEFYSDIDLSKCKILISPVQETYSETSYACEMQRVAEDRKNCMAFIGYSLSEAFTKEAIKTYHASIYKNMFSAFFVGREKYVVCNKPIALDCVAGVAGRTAAVAASLRINQSASARSYGEYYGTLTAALKFSDVLDLHEIGINSVYNSAQGPCIWGIRTLHNRQTSYFAQLNVVRVMSFILSEIIPLHISAIHTDAAQNPITRTIFENQNQSIISRYIAEQNLRPESEVLCNEDNNTDTTTQGGRILNTQLNLWFIGLVEKVSINIVATDSSVEVEVA